MKNILVIGNQGATSALLSRIRLSNKGTCMHVNNVFHSIKTIFERKIDVIVISSKELENAKLNILDFWEKYFLTIKVIISVDNGMAALQHLPESKEIVLLNNVEEIDALLTFPPKIVPPPM